MNVILDIDGPRDHEYVLEVAEALAEAVRVLNHLTRDHGAIRYPHEADRLVREVATAASRLPQLLGQVAAWLAEEQAAGRLTAEGGEHAGNPGLASASACWRLEDAAALASALQGALGGAASAASALGAVETEDDGDDA